MRRHSRARLSTLTPSSNRVAPATGTDLPSTTRPTVDAARVIAGRLALIGLLSGAAATTSAQSVDVPLTPDRWTFTGDSSRFESFLGRPSIRVGKGVAIAHDIDLRNGTIEVDVAADKTSPFLGVMFHVQSADNFEVVFFRVGASGTAEAVQYTPCLMGENAWEIVHGPDANAIASIPREQWVHVKVVMGGDTARIYVGGDSSPLLTVPRLASGIPTGSIGFWTGAFGRGGYFSNLRYVIDGTPHVPVARRALAAGTITDWELSEAIPASATHPGVLPQLSKLQWQHVQAEPWKPYHDRALGLVFINRYRRGANVDPPLDSAGVVLEDSVMDGRVMGSQVVLARTVIDADRDQFRRMHFGYANGAVVYVNGKPLFFGMDPFGLRDLGGVMETTGEAVYLPLKKGHNEIVLAVTDFFAGWGFWTRLDP